MLAEPPSWGNLVRLAQLVHDTDLEQLMGGLALMLRSGAETALEDLPHAFWPTVRRFVPVWNQAEALRAAGDHEGLDALLLAHEEAIVTSLRAEYVARIPSRRART